MSNASINLAAESAAASAAVASKVSAGGALTAIFAGITSSEIAAIGGLLIGVTGLAVQWYYRHREFRLRQREHDVAMSRAHSTQQSNGHEGV